MSLSDMADSAPISSPNRRPTACCALQPNRRSAPWFQYWMRLSMLATRIASFAWSSIWACSRMRRWSATAWLMSSTMDTKYGSAASRTRVADTRASYCVPSLRMKRRCCE